MIKRKKVKRDALDTMWAFLQIGGQKSNIPALKKYCEAFRQAMMQKTGGQEKHRNSGDIDLAEIDTIANFIVIEAMALYLSGDLDKLENSVIDDHPDGE